VSGQRSTTPQINPEALLSQERAQQSNNVAPVPPPRQEKDEDIKDKVQPDVPNLPRPAVEDPLKTRQHHANLPAGVVPAPEGYAYHHNAQVRDGSICGLDGRSIARPLWTQSWVVYVCWISWQMSNNQLIRKKYLKG